MQRPAFRMPLAPYSGYLTLAFLAGVVILMMFDKVQGPWLMGAIVFGAAALIGGWFLVRHRVRAAAEDTGVAARSPSDPSVAAYGPTKGARIGHAPVKLHHRRCNRPHSQRVTAVTFVTRCVI